MVKKGTLKGHTTTRAACDFDCLHLNRPNSDELCCRLSWTNSFFKKKTFIDKGTLKMHKI